MSRFARWTEEENQIMRANWKDNRSQGQNARALARLLSRSPAGLSYHARVLGLHGATPLPKSRIPSGVGRGARRFATGQYAVIPNGGLAKRFNSLNDLNAYLREHPSNATTMTPVKVLQTLMLIEVSE